MAFNFIQVVARGILQQPRLGPTSFLVGKQWGSKIENSTSMSTALSPNENLEAEDDELYKSIDVEVRGNDPAVLKSYSQFVTLAAKELRVETGKCWAPKKAHHDRLTLLRSIHVNKKCRVQYEMRTYFGFLQFLRLTGSTADTFLEYIQRNLPEGVAMKVTKVALKKLPDYIRPPENIQESSEKV